MQLVKKKLINIGRQCLFAANNYCQAWPVHIFLPHYFIPSWIVFLKIIIHNCKNRHQWLAHSLCILRHVQKIHVVPALGDAFKFILILCNNPGDHVIIQNVNYTNKLRTEHMIKMLRNQLEQNKKIDYIIGLFLPI